MLIRAFVECWLEHHKKRKYQDWSSIKSWQINASCFAANEAAVGNFSRPWKNLVPFFAYTTNFLCQMMCRTGSQDSHRYLPNLIRIQLRYTITRHPQLTHELCVSFNPIPSMTPVCLFKNHTKCLSLYYLSWTDTEWITWMDYFHIIYS